MQRLKKGTMKDDFSAQKKLKKSTKMRAFFGHEPKKQPI
jgi:hypothetical protein